MKRYTWLFQLNNANATDADYEAGDGDGQYVVYDKGTEIARFDGLEDTENFIKTKI